jgi:hypothetical protein
MRQLKLNVTYPTSVECNGSGQTIWDCEVCFNGEAQMHVGAAEYLVDGEVYVVFD